MLHKIIAIAMKAFNRKTKLLCGPINSNFRERSEKCDVWSVELEHGGEIWTFWEKIRINVNVDVNEIEAERNVDMEKMVGIKWEEKFTIFRSVEKDQRIFATITWGIKTG